jgi:maltose/moltooligosaccharide transporter
MIAILWTVLKTKEYSPQERIDMGIIPEEKIKEKLTIPKTMWILGVVQFFSWFGLFCMWVYTTTALREHTYGLESMDELKRLVATPEQSAAAMKQLKLSEDLGDWVGILFGIYNGVSAIFAMLIPVIARKLGKARTHFVALFLGGIGLIITYFMPDKYTMIIPMLFIGIAWASILAMPYAMLSNVIPPARMGIFMGIFNFFITLPQIVSALFAGPIVTHVFGNNAIYALVLGGAMMVIASLITLTIKNEN